MERRRWEMKRSEMSQQQRPCAAQGAPTQAGEHAQHAAPHTDMRAQAHTHTHTHHTHMHTHRRGPWHSSDVFGFACRTFDLTSSH
eukprot:5610589-Prymnesium_polylepis.1